MIFIEKMKNFRIYKCESFLPTIKNNKKKGSAILMMTPNFDASKKVMNNKMFVNSNRFSSYYLEKDVSYYINSKVVEEVDESAIISEQLEIDEILEETKRSELPDNAFGVPSKRKFPLDTEAHVRSAIKFFNYVDPDDEEELARNIKKAMKKYEINDVHVSDKNRFSKYYTNPKNESVNILNEDVYKNPDIQRTFFVPDSLGRENACIKYNGIDKPLRGRSELLIIKGDSVYLVTGKKGFASTDHLTYEVPGGAWDKGETHDVSAKREAQEESYLNVSGNPMYCGYYIISEKKPRAWVISHVKPSDWWYGYYTEVYVANYSGKYTGHVEKEDQEKAMTKGDFYKIDDVYDKLHPAHRKAIDKYRESLQHESVGIPIYHRLYPELDIYYNMWQFGTISESTAREKILRCMKNNLCISPDSTAKDVPSIKEYYSAKGALVTEDIEIVKKTDDYLSENMINHLPSNAINLGDKVIFFNEASATDSQLKRLIYKDRIKKRREILDLYDKVKLEIPWIKTTFPDLSKYVKKNVFVDLYYYNALFFENNKWISKKGINLYTDFMNRLINHPNLKSAGYTRKTIFIPVKEWDKTHDGMIWNYRKSINPISCIYELMFNSNTTQLKNLFGNTDIIFLADDKYFKVNFSEIDNSEIKKLAIKFKLFCIKICKGEDFDYSDIDTTADNKEDSDVIAAKIVDKVELAKGVDLTRHVAKAQKKVELRKKEIDSLVKTNKLPKESEKLNKKAIIDPKNLTIQPTNKKQAKKIEDDIIDDFSYIDDEEDYDDKALEDEEKLRDASKLADAIAQASELESEEDAMDELDNDEIKSILVNLGSDDEVNISAARSTRMTKIDEELLKKEINGKSIKDILEPKEETPEELLTVNVAAPNKEEWKDLSFVNLDKNYNIDKDIVSIFRMFAHTSRPMVVKDIKVTDNSTSEDRLALYDVQMEDYKGRRYRIKLDIPIMEDNRFLLRGDYKSIQTQFFNMPIIKTEADTCQLISNYKKIFLRRFGDNRGRSLPAVSKFLKACSKYAGNKLKIETGTNTKISAKYNLPMDYIDISSTISKIEYKDWIMYFDQDMIREKYVIDPTKGIPFLYNKQLKAIEYFNYDTPETTFIDTACKIIFEACPEFKELFSSVTRSSGCGFSRASLMAQKIPVVVICAYHVGLSETMRRANIQYQIVEKLTKEIKEDYNKDWIEFDDGYLVYYVNYESSMLMSGLKIKSCPTEMFSTGDIDNKDMYLEFLDNFGTRLVADGLDNFRDLFVDPMIKESLEYYNLPTDYIDILLYGSALLADSKFIKHVDTSSRRMRRYQLISVYTYQVLSTAFGKYCTMDKHTNNPVFAVKQSEVVDAFLTDTITSDDSFLNALRDVETTNAVTTKGPSGMNADRAYTLDKRSYDESMINVLGMSTGFAGNVGITRQTTINPRVTPEGYVKDVSLEMNDANSLTATENLIPFGSTRDDPMRTAMSFIQTSKHMVRTEESDPLLVTSGADEVMPYLTTDRFAYKAKWDGIIIDLNESYMLVQKTGDTKTKDYINLEETIEKNSDGGYYVPLKLEPAEGMKKNVKFVKDQILAYDKHSFSNNLGESNNIAYNIGKLAKVAILNTDEGFEDSGIISSRMAKSLATRVNLKYDCIIDKDSKVYQIAKVGDFIEASDDLIIWENAFDDESAAGIMDVLSQGSEFSDIGKRKLKSEVTGTITAIKIYRTVEVDELSPSLRKIVNAYEKPIKEKAKLLEDNNIKGKKLDAHTKLSPTGKLKKSEDAVFIEFYVEYLDTVGIGDKVVYNSANKAVEKGIFPEGKEPYTAFRPNEPIDAMLADSSISKRLVSSSYVYGSLQKLMIELDRSVKDIMGIPYDDSKV